MLASLKKFLGRSRGPKVDSALLRDLLAASDLEKAVTRCNAEFQNRKHTFTSPKEIVALIDRHFKDLLSEPFKTKIPRFLADREAFIKYWAHLEEIEGHFIAPRSLSLFGSIADYSMVIDLNTGRKYLVYPRVFKSKPLGWESMCRKLKIQVSGKTTPVEGWFITATPLHGYFKTVYLAIYCRFLFSLLLKFMNRSRDVHTVKLIDAKELTLRELLTSLNALIIEVSKFIFLLKSSPDIFQHPIDERVRRLEQTDLTHEIFNALTKLQDRTELCVPTGCLGHAIYVNFRVEKKTLLIRIDNGGLGAKKHPQNAQQLYSSYVVACLPIGQLKQHEKRLKRYIANLLFAPYLDKNEAFSRLYVSLASESPHPTLPSYPLQKVGNCTVHNYKIGSKHRAGETFYFFLSTYERHFISTIPVQGHEVELVAKAGRTQVLQNPVSSSLSSSLPYLTEHLRRSEQRSQNEGSPLHMTSESSGMKVSEWTEISPISQMSAPSSLAHHGRTTLDLNSNALADLTSETSSQSQYTDAMCRLEEMELDQTAEKTQSPKLGQRPEKQEVRKSPPPLQMAPASASSGTGKLGWVKSSPGHWVPTAHARDLMPSGSMSKISSQKPTQKEATPLGSETDEDDTHNESKPLLRNRRRQTEFFQTPAVETLTTDATQNQRSSRCCPCCLIL